MRPTRGRRATLAAWLLLTLALLAPAVGNGVPFASADTASYLRVGAGIAGALQRLATPPAERGPPTAGRPLGREELRIGATYLGARSAWYAAPAWLLSRPAGLWGVALAQAAVAAALLIAATRLVAPEASGGARLKAALALAFGSTLGIYACSAMPDLLVGLGVLAAGLVASWGDRLAWPGRGLLLLLVVTAAAVHATHAPVVLAALAVLVLAAAVARGRIAAPGRRALPVVAACLAGIALNALAREAASRVLGEPLRTPPFLMARVVADGPGRAFLERACTGSGLALCAFRDRPLDDSQTILWEADPRRGVFGAADADTRIRLIEEQGAVLRGALATDPWGLLASAVRNMLRLLLVVRLEGELEGAIPKRALDALDELAPGSAAAYRASAVARGAWPFALLDRWLALTSLAAAAVLAFRAVAGRRRDGGDEAARQRALLVLVVAALLANAALCGIASGPFPRYQMRILWLLPGTALLLLLARGGAGPVPGRDPPIRP